MPTTEHQKALDKAKINLMSRKDSAFFTTVCFSLKHEWNESIPTACTNGKSIQFNPDFFMSLGKEEQVFLLLHESMHVAFLHMDRLHTRDRAKWNVAADHVINLMLIERGFKMPAKGLADPCYTGMRTEEVYAILPDQESRDDNDLADPIGELGELQREVEDILVRAAIQSKMQNDAPGTIPGAIELFLNKLLKPKLPWQRILQKYIQQLTKNDYSWRKPNRRFFPDHYLPSLHSEKVIDLAIAVDISGSVSDEEFLRFISEIGGIMKMMKPEKISLIQFDTEIHSITSIKSFQDLKNVKFLGRGGTNIWPVMQWTKENRPQVLLTFTDGYFHFPDTSSVVGNYVWLIHNNPHFTAPLGKVIHYEISGDDK